MKRKLRAYINKFIKPKFIDYYGVKLKIDKELISTHIINIIYNYKYEKEEINILSKVLQEKDVVMEIGAGMGFISIFCSKINNNKVIAYEANPYMVNLIQENYYINNVKAKIKNIILSSKKGEVDFYVEKNFYSSSTLKRSEKAKLIKVKTEDINNEIIKYNPTFLIIDIEGGENELIYKVDFQKYNIIIKYYWSCTPIL